MNHPLDRMLDARWFIRRLGIIDVNLRKRHLNPIFGEQEEFLHALIEEQRKRVFVLKCRQVGMTTMTAAYFFWKLYTSKEPRSLLSIGHESGVCARINQMLRYYREALPPPIRPEWKRENGMELVFAHNDSSFRQLMAGGRGQARSYTYSDIHASEMAFWPEGSAAAKGNSVSRDLWASTMSTVHDPRANIIIESTADGATGLYHDLYKVAARPDSAWKLLFFPWYNVQRYRKPVEDPERFHDSLDADERRLMADYGLDLEQVAFRRFKLTDDQYSPLRFRREYPFNQLDPFLLSGGGWFDSENLTRIAAGIDPKWSNDQAELHIHAKPIPGKRYFIGHDTAGGVGKDYSVIKVKDAQLNTVAKWSSNRKSPQQQADMGMRLCAMYGNALMLVELNNHGQTVFNAYEKAGISLWRNDKGKGFSSLGGRAGKTKREAYSWARYIIDSGFDGLTDPTTVTELADIIEHGNGKIEASTKDKHDDHADAEVLALWCARKYWERGSDRMEEKSRAARLRSRADNPLGTR